VANGEAAEAGGVGACAIGWGGGPRGRARRSDASGVQRGPRSAFTWRGEAQGVPAAHPGRTGRFHVHVKNTQGGRAGLGAVLNALIELNPFAALAPRLVMILDDLC